MHLLRVAACLFLFGFIVAGCDKLFPELNNTSGDLAVAAGDGGTDFGTGQLTGKVCILADLRAPSSCLSPAPNRHVTIEESRAAAEVASDGSFTISLAGITTKATFAVTDQNAAVGLSKPTVSVYSGAQLAAALGAGVGLPVVQTSALSNMELANGGDPTHGSVLTWLIDPKGASVAGASVTRITGAIGPLYDSQGTSELMEGAASGKYGTVAFLDLPPGDVTLTIATPETSTVLGDSFKLPIRAGAITVAALQLPAR